MPSRPRWSLAIVAALAFAAPVSAQWKTLPAAVRVSNASATSITGGIASTAPTLEGATSRVDVTRGAFSAPVLPGQARESQNVALMIVGGAALVVGAVIGGDAGTLIMVGGGVAGLIGLYRYLR